MNIPKELKEITQWVCWRLVPDNAGGKDRKLPFNPETGKAAASNKPETWTTFENASKAVDRYGYTGLGFMFQKEGGIVGVDIDHCYDAETGTFNEVATAILERAHTYTEFSPSGTGLHLYFKGTKPGKNSKNSNTQVEMYDSVRFFTFTGNVLAGTPNEIASDDETLAWIYDTYLAKKKKPTETKKKKSKLPAPLDDEDVLEKAQTASDGDTFSNLWSGNWQGFYESQSEADMSMCLKLAFWTGKNREQMDRLFRQSGLYRPKWDERHHSNGSTYGEETLDRAIELTENVYTPSNKSQIFEYEGKYFRAKGEASYVITNFVIRPLEMIVADEETQLTADLVTVHGEIFRMTFMTSDFGNTQKFKSLLNRNTIALSYFGGDGDLELLKEYIAQLSWVCKTGVKALGIYERDGRQVFVTYDGSIDANGNGVEDIVQMGKYKDICTDMLSAELLPADVLKELGRDLLTFNDAEKTVPILAWCAGCFVKEYLRQQSVKFPHLFLIGEAGSGKSTTLERVILPMFSTGRVTAASQVTAFTVFNESASSSLIPQSMDEFKPSKMENAKLNILLNLFRDSYDGHSAKRGRADLSVTEYKLLAPLIVAGEESADETAIRERTLELLFSKKDLKNPDCRQAFNRLSRREQALQNFGRTLLHVALSLKPEMPRSWYDEGLSLFTQELPSRIVNNLACGYAGLKLVETMCASYKLSWDEVFPIKLDACVRYLDMSAKDYLLDGRTNNQSIIEQTFEIMARMELDPRSDYMLSEDGTTLYIRLTQVYDKYTKYRKDYAIMGEVLPYAQFKKQLTHSDLLIQSNAQKRIGQNSVKCWIIDFSALSARCDVSGFITTDVVPLI